MRSFHRVCEIVVLGALAMAGLAPGAARADIFAATCVQGPSSQDIAVLNASLGTPIALPAAVNAPDASELRPSISTDGRRLLFRRMGPGAADRLIVVDLATGQSADLFTAFELAENPMFGSAITPDGTIVATGRYFRKSPIGYWIVEATLSNIQSFPTGPITRSRLRLSPNTSTSRGIVRDVAAGGGGLYAFQVEGGSLGFHFGVFLKQTGGSTSGRQGCCSQPALAAVSSAHVLFENQGQILFMSATITGFSGSLEILEFGVSTPRRESVPAQTADGRYVAFVRDAEGANDRLFVFDSQTQTFLNPNGIDLGMKFNGVDCGSTSLYVRSVITTSVITRSGSVTATLRDASSIGIIVQRIVGRTRVLGRKTWKLEPVGRVPLGSFGAGNVFTHWDFEVDGKPLPPGRYLVTLRAVEDDVVRELGKPQVLKIRRGKA